MLLSILRPEVNTLTRLEFAVFLESAEIPLESFHGLIDMVLPLLKGDEDAILIIPIYPVDYARARCGKVSFGLQSL